MVNLPQRRKARIQYEFLIIEKESFSEHKEENQDLQSPNSKIGKAVYSIFPIKLLASAVLSDAGVTTNFV